MPKYYTGVGSRETPVEMQMQMTIMGMELEKLGFILRSGGACGADRAFEHGVKNPANKRIYLPDDTLDKVPEHVKIKAIEIALANHPNRQAALRYIKWLGRNPFQVLGDDLKTPSEFLISWTKDGKDIGGTGTTIRIAKSYNIPVYTLATMSKEDIMDRIVKQHVRLQMW